MSAFVSFHDFGKGGFTANQIVVGTLHTTGSGSVPDASETPTAIDQTNNTVRRNRLRTHVLTAHPLGLCVYEHVRLVVSSARQDTGGRIAVNFPVVADTNDLTTVERRADDHAGLRLPRW